MSENVCLSFEGPDGEELFTTYVTAETFAKIQKGADELGVTVEEYVVRILNDEMS